MKLIIGSDHPGFEVKKNLVAFLTGKGHTVHDAGTDSPDSCDYPEFAFKVAQAVAGGECRLGILICGTGIGMSITANRIRGIRAALCHNLETARLSREHNDANILCVGARVVGEKQIEEIVSTFLETGFEGGRHERRLAMIDKVEV